jgi:hypothetical protein
MSVSDYVVLLPHSNVTAIYTLYRSILYVYKKQMNKTVLVALVALLALVCCVSAFSRQQIEAKALINIRQNWRYAQPAGGFNQIQIIGYRSRKSAISYQIDHEVAIKHVKTGWTYISTILEHVAEYDYLGRELRKAQLLFGPLTRT